MSNLEAMFLSALSNDADVSRYDFVESAHPRGQPANAGQFSRKASTAVSNPRKPTDSKVVPARPAVAEHHSLHIRNQSGDLRNRVTDWAKSLKNEYARAQRVAGSNSESEIWKHVDKRLIAKRLEEMNKIDRDSGGKAASVVNYNGIMPEWLSPRLKSGSKYFDPSKLRGKWHEAKPVEPEAKKKQGEDSPLLENMNREGVSPGGIQDRATSRMQKPVEAVRELSPQKDRELTEAIRAMVGDDSDMIDAFKDIAVKAWKMLGESAREHNDAIREIAGTISKFGGTGSTVQSLAALTRAARNGTLDPSRKKAFDEMVDSAERRYPEMLGGRGEDGLIDLFAQGIKEEPDILSEEVANLAHTMAGPGFFRDRSQDQEDDSFDFAVPYSADSLAHAIERYWVKDSEVSVPTESQSKAGNYKKAHLRWKGLGITVETPKGRSRRLGWPKMSCHYGYIKGTKAIDGDQIDVFLGPDETSEIVFVVDQVSPDGKWDEYKVMLGFTTKQDAVDAYLASYTKGWRLGQVTAMTIDQFKTWLAQGNHQKPLHLQVSKYSSIEDALACVKKIATNFPEK